MPRKTTISLQAKRLGMSIQGHVLQIGEHMPERQVSPWLPGFDSILIFGRLLDVILNFVCRVISVRIPARITVLDQGFLIRPPQRKTSTRRQDEDTESDLVKTLGKQSKKNTSTHDNGDPGGAFLFIPPTQILIQYTPYLLPP